MQKFMNKPEDFVEEMLEGVLLAHGDKLRCLGDRHSLVRAAAPHMPKVGIVTGGGSGHLPLFLGYVGTGLLDGVAVGDVFASPTSQQILDVTRAVNTGRGVLYLYGNYGGDVMNFDLASELAVAEGISVETIVAADDVASAPKGEEAKRRGIAGMILLYKVAGAAAEAGESLEEVMRLTRSAAAKLRSFGVALSPMILPSAARATFDVPDGKMEVGMGIHGEPGISREDLEVADCVADKLLDPILAELDVPPGSEVAIVLNSLGSTSQEELYVLYRRVFQRFDALNVSIRRRYVGRYATSLEMAGASLSVLVLDDEIAPLIDAAADTPFFRQS